VVNGGAKCWGYNSYGQLGTNGLETTVPGDVLGLMSGVTDIVAAATHTCAVTAGGGAKCWGQGQSGELGHGVSSSSTTPVDVVGMGSGVTAIAASSYTTCVIQAGAGYCWGGGTHGQLGNGGMLSSNVPVSVNGLSSGLDRIAAGAAAIYGNNGGRHECGLSGGAVRCWGRNDRGQLGNGSTMNSPVPVAVAGAPPGVTTIAANGFHSCAVTAAGSVKCWGDNERGQLGDGSTTNSSVAVDVQGISGAIDIAAGGYHTCAIVTGGQIQCWGANNAGQLGDGGTADSAVPVDVVGL
jgi:alpha-tubulin suppressor-like RCC1 family protein